MELDGGFEVVAETSDGAEVLPLVGRTDPDVALLDVRMPGADGLTCLDRIRRRYPGVKVVLCSMSADPEQVQEAFMRGASGYIVKNVGAKDLGSAIRQAVEGTAYHALGLPAINEDTIARAAGLTARELQIMRAVARGRSNSMIGAELSITEQTVKFHLGNVYRKLGISSRTEAVRWALGHRIEPA